MDIYITLLSKKTKESIASTEFFMFPSTFASFSLFSLTTSSPITWAVEPEEILENYQKFFPSWKTEQIAGSKFFLWPYRLDNVVWILLSLREDKNGFTFEFYHPFGKSMYDFLYIIRYVLHGTSHTNKNPKHRLAFFLQAPGTFSSSIKT